jgi:hypothetical protein
VTIDECLPSPYLRATAAAFQPAEKIELPCGEAGCGGSLAVIAMRQEQDWEQEVATWTFPEEARCSNGHAFRFQGTTEQE